MNPIYNLPGIGDVPVNKETLVDKGLVSDYQKLVKDIQFIYSKTTPLTQEDAQNLHNALTSLQELIKKGKTVDGMTHYFSTKMLDETQTIFGLFEAVGIKNGGNFNDFKAGIDYLKNVDNSAEKGKSLSAILETATGDRADETQSLQEMVRFWVYEKATANFNSNMSDLKEQLEINKETASLIADLQAFKNSHLTDPSGSVLTQDQKDGTNPVSLKVGNIKDEDLPKYLEYRGKIEKLIHDLEGKGVSKTQEGSVANALDKVLKDLDEGLKPLFDELKKAGLKDNASMQDITKFISSLPQDKQKSFNGLIAKGLTYWVKDNYNLMGTKSGNFQVNLTKAATAATNLNETQKEALKEIQSKYESIMKFAISLMDGIQKSLNKILQGIGRG